MENKLLTTKEVAEYFQVSSDTVLVNFIKRGLRYIPVSTKDYRYEMQDVLDFKDMIKTTYEDNDYFDYKIKVNRFKNVKCNRKYELI